MELARCSVPALSPRCPPLPPWPSAFPHPFVSFRLTSAFRIASAYKPFKRSSWHLTPMFMMFVPSYQLGPLPCTG